MTPRRSERTRKQITTAFTAIVFADGFDNVTVRRIIEDANVARSTFYEYFSSKDDVLRACMSQFLSVIADTVANDTCPPNLVPVLEHLWEKRRLTDAIFTGSARSILGLTLSEMIEAHLRASRQGSSIPHRLASIQLAEGQLALIEAWLRGRAYSSIPDLAGMLHNASRASAKALLA